MLKSSIIIPTYNGAGKVVKVLNSIQEQALKPLEVIVVIDGSTDETYSILEGLNLDINLKIINQDNGGRSVSRNNGAKQAQGDILVFFDDDMRPVKECLAVHVKHHVQKPGTVMVGSQIEDFEVITSDIQYYKAHMARVWERPLAKGERILQKSNLFLTAANFSISKKLFWEVGGFDERLTDAEDFDLAVRLYKSKISIYFNENAIAWHDDFITCKSYIKRQIQYRKAHSLLKNLKPALYQDFNNHQVETVSYWKKVLFYFFSFYFWQYTIDHFNWLRVLPKKMRFKIYSFVITARSLYFPAE